MKKVSLVGTIRFYWNKTKSKLQVLLQKGRENVREELHIQVEWRSINLQQGKPCADAMCLVSFTLFVCIEEREKFCSRPWWFGPSDINDSLVTKCVEIRRKTAVMSEWKGELWADAGENTPTPKWVSLLAARSRCESVYKHALQLFLSPCDRMFAILTFVSSRSKGCGLVILHLCVYLCDWIHTADRSWRALCVSQWEWE